jgi:hypothetical protein
MLGRLALPRLVALDLGIALMTIAQVAGWQLGTLAGLGLTALGFATTAFLIGSAVAIGIRWTQARGAATPSG